MKEQFTYPFTAIVGQEDFKLCLLLNAIDPLLGGILATGDKGTGKTTTVRALSQLLGEEAPFVNLPIGATEDRVLGSIQLETLLKESQTSIHRGLLNKADGGFLYIDEVNLLNDYLMDVLLDASTSGGYHLEREGLSEWMSSRFCLVGTMNPEEGSLRPQLLDRFGLSVEIRTPEEVTLRKEIVKRRLQFDSNPKAFIQRFAQEEALLKGKLIEARTRIEAYDISDELLLYSAELCLQHKVEGMRADILILKAARAYAAFIGATELTKETLDKVAPFVLHHRSKNSDESPQSNSNPDTSKSDTSDPSSQNTSGTATKFQLPENVKAALKTKPKSTLKSEMSASIDKKMFTHAQQPTEERKIDVFQTVKKYCAREADYLSYKFKREESDLHVVFMVDTSASMAVDKQLGYLKGLLLKTLAANPRRKIKYAIVSLRETTAVISQPFTTNLTLLSEKSKALKAGGKTNLKAAFVTVAQLIKAVNLKTVQLFVLTDGRANTGGKQPFQAAISSYKKFLGQLKNTTVVDTETGFVKLGLAKKLADALRVTYLPLTHLKVSS